MRHVQHADAVLRQRIEQVVVNCCPAAHAGIEGM